MRKLAATLCLTLAVLLGSEVRGSDLPVCEGSPKEINNLGEIPGWSFCKGVITKMGVKYIGEFQGGKIHGFGEFTPKEGHLYVGELKQNRLEGQGTYNWPDGNKYVGEWRNNKKHGQGTFTYACLTSAPAGQIEGFA